MGATEIDDESNGPPVTAHFALAERNLHLSARSYCFSGAGCEIALRENERLHVTSCIFSHAARCQQGEHELDIRLACRCIHANHRDTDGIANCCGLRGEVLVANAARSVGVQMTLLTGMHVAMPVYYRKDGIMHLSNVVIEHFNY